MLPTQRGQSSPPPLPLSKSAPPRSNPWPPGTASHKLLPPSSFVPRLRGGRDTVSSGTTRPIRLHLVWRWGWLKVTLKPKVVGSSSPSGLAHECLFFFCSVWQVSLQAEDLPAGIRPPTSSAGAPAAEERKPSGLLLPEDFARRTSPPPSYGRAGNIIGSIVLL